MNERGLSLNPDPWNAWIYDPRHPDYSSPQAENLRRRRAQAIATAPRWMIDAALDSDAERERRGN